MKEESSDEFSPLAPLNHFIFMHTRSDTSLAGACLWRIFFGILIKFVIFWNVSRSMKSWKSARIRRRQWTSILRRPNFGLVYIISCKFSRGCATLSALPLECLDTDPPLNWPSLFAQPCSVILMNSPSLYFLVIRRLFSSTAPHHALCWLNLWHFRRGFNGGTFVGLVSCWKYKRSAWLLFFVELLNV